MSCAAISGCRPCLQQTWLALTHLVGVDRVLFGSDWQHTEGTEQSADDACYIKKLDPEDTTMVLTDNALSLLPASPLTRGPGAGTQPSAV